MQHFSRVPISIFCRCRHFSVGGASGRGGVDSRGQGMASEEFGPCPNSLAQTHQPRGGQAALLGASKQGETTWSWYRPYSVAQTQDFSRCSPVVNDVAVSQRGKMFSAGRSDWRRPFAQTQQNEPTPLDTAWKTSVTQQDVWVQRAAYKDTKLAWSVHFTSKYKIYLTQIY